MVLNLPAGGDVDRVAEAVSDWICLWLSHQSDEEVSVTASDHLSDFGLDSLAAMELASEIEDWTSVEVSPMTVIEHPTVGELARYVARSHAASDAEVLA